MRACRPITKSWTGASELDPCHCVHRLGIEANWQLKQVLPKKRRAMGDAVHGQLPRYAQIGLRAMTCRARLGHMFVVEANAGDEVLDTGRCRPPEHARHGRC